MSAANKTSMILSITSQFSGQRQLQLSVIIPHKFTRLCLSLHIYQVN